METDSLTRALNLLEKVEWQYEDGHGPPQCPLCAGWGDGQGHARGCELAALLDTYRSNRKDPWIPTTGLDPALMNKLKARRADTA